MCKYEPGKIVTGCVTGIESYGIFIGLDDYYNGLIHISEISSGFVKNINDYVKIGETIRVKVLEVDKDMFQVKLSIKGINYNINKPKRLPIVETPLGFSTLRDLLDNWIEIKMTKIKTLDNL
ncbi:MAG: S1 RNA-binding domain-containing protein [Tenericutes bacterium]|jgi:general stress protein 13|nr:S1 RNA-binding domain-containing protein [Mycoplasmatota bacterium]